MKIARIVKDEEISEYTNRVQIGITMIAVLNI